MYCLVSSHKHPSKNSTHYYRNIKNLNGDVYRDDLYDTLTPIVQKFQTSSISAFNFDLHFNNLIIGIKKVIETHAPLQKVSRKLSRIRQEPWMTKELLISIKNKQKLYRNFFLKGTAFGKHFYKAYANKLTRVKNLSKKMYYTEFISKNKSNPKKMWEIINSAISTKSVISPLTKINIENLVIEDSSKIADCFNQFFVEIGHSIANNGNEPLRTDYTTY